MNCKTCERRNKEKDECLVLKTKQKNCWAWTDDPSWGRKVADAVKKYKQYKNYKIGKYWGDAK